MTDLLEQEISKWLFDDMKKHKKGIGVINKLIDSGDIYIGSADETGELNLTMSAVINGERVEKEVGPKHLETIKKGYAIAHIINPLQRYKLSNFSEYASRKISVQEFFNNDFIFERKKSKIASKGHLTEEDIYEETYPEIMKMNISGQYLD